MNNQNSHSKFDGLFDLPFLLTVIFLLVSIFAFNNVITFDSHLYYKLSQEVTSSWGGWDVARTPIFPALLAAIDGILGKGPLNFVVLNTVFLVSGCYLVNVLLRRYGVRRGYRFVAALAFVSPALVTYQHTLLSEAGLALTLLIVVWVSLAEFSSSNRRYFALGFVLTLAYYYKPHYKYLALLIFVMVYIAKDLRFSIRRPAHGWFSSFKAPAAGLIVFIILIYPWDRALQISGRLEPLNYFPIATGVVPPTEQHFGPYLGAYKKAIENPENISRGGISGHLVYPLLAAPDKHLLKAAIIENPFGYTKAFFRTLTVYIWSPSRGSENWVFFQGVFGLEPGLTRTKVYNFTDSMPELRDSVIKRFDSAYSQGLIAKFFVQISPLLNLIVAIFVMLLPFAFFRAILKKNPAAFITSGTAIGYLGMHAAALMCIDRYAAPTIPLIFCAVVIAFFMPKQDNNNVPGYDEKNVS